MGRGLSPQQREILVELVEIGKPIPIIDIDRVYDGEDSEIDRQYDAGRAKQFRRNRTFACRRALSAMERRGLVKIVWVKDKSQRRTRYGEKVITDRHLLAAKLTPAGQAEYDRLFPPPPPQPTTVAYHYRTPDGAIVKTVTYEPDAFEALDLRDEIARHKPPDGPSGSSLAPEGSRPTLTGEGGAEKAQAASHDVPNPEFPDVPKP